jgi:site-specific DNA-cytosine methylase
LARTLAKVCGTARNQIKVLDIFSGAGGPTQGFYLAWPRFKIGVRWLFQTSELHLARDYAAHSLRRLVDTPAGGNGFDLPEELLAPCWVKHQTGSADVTGRLDWDRPIFDGTNRVLKPEKGRYIHPPEHRGITHLETAISSGFPRQSTIDRVK